MLFSLSVECEVIIGISYPSSSGVHTSKTMLVWGGSIRRELQGDLRPENIPLQRETELAYSI